MRYLYKFLTMVVALFTATTWAEVNSPTWHVFTKFEDLPAFYLQLRPQNPQSRSKLSTERKYEICWYIIRPSEGDLIRPEEHYRELERDYRNIFDELFHMPKFCSKHGYANRSKSRTFLIREVEYDEMTFVCLVRSPATGQIMPYYVSSYQYDVNEASGGPAIAGRFVFVGGRVYGLAEKCPIMRSKDSRRSFETYYTSKCDGRSVAKTFDMDPICKLDTGRKLRLCTYACFEISAGCGVSVAVENCELKQFLVRNILYDGWMLTCRIEGEQYRYITRSYSNNEVFVFKNNDDGRITLEYNMLRVSVVTDAMSTKK